MKPNKKEILQKIFTYLSCLLDQTFNHETTNTNFFSTKFAFFCLAQNRSLFENQDRLKNVDADTTLHFYHFLVYLDSQTKICFEPKTQTSHFVGGKNQNS